MRPPCEVIALQVLPSIRSELARILMERHGLSQREIAERLGLSKAAVSQYVSEKRGQSRDFPDDIRVELESLAGVLASGAPVDRSLGMLCSTCKDIQESGFLCELHSAKSNCTFCRKE